jgi:hypothetical protein
MNAPKLFTSTHNPCLLPPGSQDTAADAPAKSASAAFSFESAAPVSPTAAADKAGVADRSPVLAAPVTSSNLLTPNVNASSQPDRVVSGAGKDHAFIVANLHMRSFPYSAVGNRNRFDKYFNPEQFLADTIGGEA